MNFRIARSPDTAAVSSVLSAAAAKLVDEGRALWGAAETSEAAVAPHVQAGLYHLGVAGDEIVGVFRLQGEDAAFWPEVPAGTSAFLHKLAVLPRHQGRGFAHALLAHAVEVTRGRGLAFLRLDCVAGRPGLRAVYETFGFRHHSDWQVGRTVFHRFEVDVGAGTRT